MKNIKTEDIKKVVETYYLAKCPTCKDVTHISESEMKSRKSSCDLCYRFFEIVGDK